MAPLVRQFLYEKARVVAVSLESADKSLVVLLVWAWLGMVQDPTVATNSDVKEALGQGYDCEAQTSCFRDSASV